MIRLLAILLLLTLTACLEEEDNYHNSRHSDIMAESDMASGYAMRAPNMVRSNNASPAVAMKMQASDMALDRSQFAGRRIAESHNLNIEAELENFQQRYQRDMKQCILLGCEITGSNVQSNGHGYLNARIAPEKLSEYLDFLAIGKGEIKSHQVSADDKTMQYVDTESKLKNQKALHLRLLRLLDSAKAKKIDEILRIERELTRVQSQIDSLTGQMRSLRNITAKATVNISYSIPPRAIELEYHDIGDSLRYAWNGLLRSVSDVIKFVLKIIPWIPIWFIGLWLFVKVFRFAFSNSGGALHKLAFWKKEATK